MYKIYVCNNCINNDECLLKSSKNKITNMDMPAKGVLKKKGVLTTVSPILFFLQGIIHNNTFNTLYILTCTCISIYNKMNTNWA